MDMPICCYSHSQALHSALRSCVNINFVEFVSIFISSPPFVIHFCNLAALLYCGALNVQSPTMILTLMYVYLKGLPLGHHLKFLEKISLWYHLLKVNLVLVFSLM